MAAKPLNPTDYKLTLVKDLGTIKINGSKGKRRAATFSCDVCGSNVDLAVAEAKKAECTNCLKIAQAKEAEAYKDDGYIQIISGVYYTQHFKHKKNKTILLSMNELRNSHYYMQNNIKSWYTDYFMGLFIKNPPVPIVGQYEVAYVYYYKNCNSDLGNVASLVDKYFCDALQKAGIVMEDNVQYCKKITFLVGEEDKLHPRVEIFVRPWVN